MKISHHAVPYSDIPRLAKEGKIKVGTRVRACKDQNELIVTELDSKKIKLRDFIYCGSVVMFFDKLTDQYSLDIISDEEEEINGLKIESITYDESVHSGVPKPLSFSEPLTKEAVGRVIVNKKGERRKILDIGMTGNMFALSRVEDHVFYSGDWKTIEGAKRSGWHFESSPDEIFIEETEKLTGKKIKR
jgi:hypothetical protein